MIASKSGKDKAVVSQALAKLGQIGIAAKRKAIGGVGLERGWDIIDGYFRFFYRFVFPYVPAIEYGTGEGAMMQAMKEINQFTAREMEKAFRRFILTHYGMPISTIGSVEFPDRITHQNEEIVLVALIPPSSMLFGECKWTGSPVDTDVFRKLAVRADLAYPEVADKRYCLMSRSGYTERMRQLASQGDGKLLLLTAEDMVRTR